MKLTDDDACLVCAHSRIFHPLREGTCCLAAGCECREFREAPTRLPPLPREEPMRVTATVVPGVNGRLAVEFSDATGHVVACLHLDRQTARGVVDALSHALALEGQTT